MAKKRKKSADNLSSYVQRCRQKTPPFFKKLRTAGIVIAAVGTSVLAAPVALPAIAVVIAGYLATAGAVVTAVSQAAIKDGEPSETDY